MHTYDTPYHKFTLPVNFSRVAELYITYSQYDEVLVEKTKKDCIVKGDRIILVHLEQEDSAKFRECDNYRAQLEVQMTVLTVGGQRITSKPRKLDAKEARKRGVI